MFIVSWKQFIRKVMEISATSDTAFPWLGIATGYGLDDTRAVAREQLCGDVVPRQRNKTQ
jgi:hypothetical protein